MVATADHRRDTLLREIERKRASFSQQLRAPGKRAVQSGEGHAGEPAREAPLQTAEGQGPNQPDQAPAQGEIRFAPTAVHANSLAFQGLQLGLNGEDENPDVGQGIPAIAAAGPGNAAGRRCGWIGGARSVEARHQPDRVSLRSAKSFYEAEQPLPPSLISRTASKPLMWLVESCRRCSFLELSAVVGN